MSVKKIRDKAEELRNKDEELSDKEKKIDEKIALTKYLHEFETPEARDRLRLAIYFKKKHISKQRLSGIGLQQRSCRNSFLSHFFTKGIL